MREELKNLGLTEEEINIYLLLLQKGALKVTQISKELSVARTTIYRFITSLHEKGIVSETIEDYVKTYTPIPPENLPEILLNRVAGIQSIVPQLNKIYSKPLEKTEVSVFRGREGIKVVMNDIIREGKPYTCAGEIEKYFEELDIFTKKWMREVETARIKGKLLGSKKQKFEVAKTEECKFLPEELIPEITTVTYAEKTALFIWSKPLYVILIENKKVTESNLKVFNHLWQTAKP